VNMQSNRRALRKRFLHPESSPTLRDVIQESLVRFGAFTPFPKKLDRDWTPDFKPFGLSVLRSL
jgi:hypothetical protein